MRKLSFILILALAMVLGLGIGTALAYGVHGGYTSDTATCGQCHSTHAAAGQRLIQNLGGSAGQNDMYRTCVYCHDGTNSIYNVVDGAIDTTDSLSNPVTYAASAGGFTQMVTTEGSTPVYTAVTSSHDVSAANGTTVWVPGNEGSSTDTTNKLGWIELTCTSCHDPHSAGRRAFKTTVLAATVNPVMTVTTTTENDEEITYQSGWNTFCGACHEDFNQTVAGSGSDTTLGTHSQFARHRVGMDPSTYSGVNSTSWTIAGLSQPSDLMPLMASDGTAATQQVMCLTCHLAHGTVKGNTVTFNRADGTTTNSSTLLRLPNRGVCEACHNK
jgi:hypothetical protein